MKPTSIIYWTRVLLGVAAAFISTLVSFVGDISFLNGITIALLIYIVTYYIYKPIFLTKVEKPTKIFTTGIFAYFMTWLVTWTILYTILFKIPS